MDVPLFVTETADEAATAAIGTRLAAILAAGDVLALSGPLGSGKTVLARALVRSRMGLPELGVPSPSFTLVQIFEPPDGPAIWHVDLYRLEHADELEELGLEEAFEDAITLVEWAEKAASFLPRQALRIRIEPTERGQRRLAFYGDRRWRARLAPRFGPAP